MSDGGYSRLEKDFLGNERMVHYDGSGNMIGASDVVREPDGTLRVTNEPVNAASSASDLPDVQVIEPTPKAAAKVEDVPEVRVAGFGPKRTMPMGQTATYVIATFVVAMLLTLMFMRTIGGRRSASQEFQTIGNRTPVQNYTPQNDPLPDRTEDRYPADPKPRNDEQPDNNQPFDQSAPDMNSGDNNHPKIDPDNGQSDPNPGPKKGGDSDPIDLRGDGEKDPPKTDPPKGDPNDIH